MTGKDIIEAMSFVDDAYIDEAEYGKLNSTVKPLVRIFLPLAACFCLAFLGMNALDRLQPREETAADKQNLQYGSSETLLMDKEHTELQSENELMMDAQIAQSVSNEEMSSVVLRIEQWTEDGFTAIVTERGDKDFFTPGTTVHVLMQENICIEVYSECKVIVERRVPTEADFPAGSLVQVRFDTGSQVDHTIRIEAIAREEE